LLNLTLFLIVGSLLAALSAAFREARDRAEAAREKLQRFFNSTGDAFMAFDSEWRYVYVNPRAAQFARLPVDAMIGRTLFELFPDIRTVPYFAATDTVMRDRYPVNSVS